MFGLLLLGCLNTTIVIKVATEAIEVDSDFEEGATEMTLVVSGDISIQDVCKEFVQASNHENLEIMTELEKALHCGAFLLVQLKGTTHCCVRDVPRHPYYL